MISNRHIRHDWNTWLDQEQVSVRTVCGVTTRRHLAGIPGITAQKDLVPVGNKVMFGWCPRCAIKAYSEMCATIDDPMIHPLVKSLYLGGITTLYAMVSTILDEARAKDWSQRRAVNEATHEGITR